MSGNRQYPRQGYRRGWGVPGFWDVALLGFWDIALFGFRRRGSYCHRLGVLMAGYRQYPCQRNRGGFRYRGRGSETRRTGHGPLYVLKKKL